MYIQSCWIMVYVCMYVYTIICMILLLEDIIYHAFTTVLSSVYIAL